MSNNSDEIKALELERRELNLLIKNGVKFHVTTKLRRRKKGLRGFFSRPEAIEETHTFEIHEPTLSTLDRVSELSLAMEIDEAAVENRDYSSAPSIHYDSLKGLSYYGEHAVSAPFFTCKTGKLQAQKQDYVCSKHVVSYY